MSAPNDFSASGGVKATKELESSVEVGLRSDISWRELVAGQTTSGVLVTTSCGVRFV